MLDSRQDAYISRAAWRYPSDLDDIRSDVMLELLSSEGRLDVNDATFCRVCRRVIRRYGYRYFERARIELHPDCDRTVGFDWSSIYLNELVGSLSPTIRIHVLRLLHGNKLKLSRARISQIRRIIKTFIDRT